MRKKRISLVTASEKYLKYLHFDFLVLICTTTMSSMLTQTFSSLGVKTKSRSFLMPMSKTSMMGKRMEVALNVWINHNVTKQSSCNPVKRCTLGEDVIIPTNSQLPQLIVSILPLKWGSPGERESQVDTSLASQKVTFGQT